MNEVLHWIPVALSCIAGLAIGAVFFGGLWWTVRRGVYSKRPALLFTASMVARTAFALTGFYFVSDHHWERSIACLVGFIAARMVVRLRVERMQPANLENRFVQSREASNAS